MPKFRKNGEVKILGETLLVNDVLENLLKLSSATAVTFFNELNLSFSRKLRVSALKNVFRNSVIETRQNRHTLADEMNYRLSWFNQFTETQLVNLFKFYKDEKLERNFKELLWVTLLNDMDNQGVKDHDFKRLFEMTDTAKEKDIIEYNNNMNSVFYDLENEIDGLTQDQIRPVLYKSSTITEIRELGKKYGVNVPTRLRKNELIKLICDELKERNEYTEEKEAELNKMNLILIQRYTKLNDIKVSTELKKEEVIEYILSNAKTTKGSYYVPSASLYEEIVEKEQPKEVLEQPTKAKEEKEPQVVEEEPVVEEKPVVEEQPKVEKEVIVEEKVVYVDRPVEKIVYRDREVVKPTKELDKSEFDYANVRKVELNTTEFHGEKARKFNDIIDYQTYLSEEEVLTQEVVKDTKTVEKDTRRDEYIPLKGVYKITPLDERKRKKKRNFFVRFLLFLLTLVFIIALVLFVYALATHKGTPSSPEFISNVEDAINKVFGFNLFEKLRNITSKILG